MSAHTIGVGRIGRDAELRYTSGSNEPVCNFPVAFDYGRRDESGNRPTTWIECTLWGKRAEALAQYLQKGKQIHVVLSDLRLDTFQKSDGTAGAKMAARIVEIELVGNRKDDNGGSADSYATPRQAAPQPQRQPSSQATSSRSYDVFDQDDIPF